MQDMNGNFLFDLLVDPETGNRLFFDTLSNSLISSGSGKRYALIDSIPRIISDENRNIVTSAIHRKYNSGFNYIDHYQKDAEFFDYSRTGIPAITKHELRRLHESVIRETEGEMEIILDVGCGNGWVSKKLIPLGKKVISMDISTENPLKAIRDLKHENHAGLIADAYNIPLKESSVDCVIASEILEHVPDPRTLISGFVRLLKPGGKLIITVPYNENIEYNLCVHCNRPTPRYAHLNSFNEHNISQFIPDKGISWKVTKSLDRYLIRIRSHLILRFLPYDLWRLIDSLFGKVFNKPTRLKVIIRKL